MADNQRPAPPVTEGIGEQPPPNKNQKYRQWPKKRRAPNDSRWTLNREKLREMYLANPHYSWKEFCKDHGYNPSARNAQEFPVKQWQQEWIQQALDDQDEDAIAKAVAARPQLLAERVKFIEEWNKTAKSMKSIHDYMLYRVEKDIQHDIRNKELIAAKQVMPRFTLTPAQWVALTLAGEKLAGIASHSLLLSKDTAIKDVLPIPGKTETQRDEEAALQELQTLNPTLIGAPVSDPAALAASLAAMFDQFDGSPKDVESEVAQPSLPSPEAVSHAELNDEDHEEAG